MKQQSNLARDIFEPGWREREAERNAKIFAAVPIQSAPRPPADARIVRLQVNTTGAWRNVMDFDLTDESEVLHAAPQLFGNAVHPGSLRIVVPGETGWLANWTPSDGWRDHKGEAL